jgi:hypothetical protein
MASVYTIFSSIYRKHQFVKLDIQVTCRPENIRSIFHIFHQELESGARIEDIRSKTGPENLFSG